jgi:hypothetical protein
MAILHKPTAQPDPAEAFDHPVFREGEKEQETRPGFQEDKAEARGEEKLPLRAEVEIPKQSLAERIRTKAKK